MSPTYSIEREASRDVDSLEQDFDAMNIDLMDLDEEDIEGTSNAESGLLLPAKKRAFPFASANTHKRPGSQPYSMDFKRAKNWDSVPPAPAAPHKPSEFGTNPKTPLPWGTPSKPQSSSGFSFADWGKAAGPPAPAPQKTSEFGTNPKTPLSWGTPSKPQSSSGFLFADWGKAAGPPAANKSSPPSNANQSSLGHATSSDLPMSPRGRDPKSITASFAMLLSSPASGEAVKESADKESKFDASPRTSTFSETPESDNKKGALEKKDRGSDTTDPKPSFKPAAQEGVTSQPRLRPFEALAALLRVPNEPKRYYKSPFSEDIEYSAAATEYDSDAESTHPEIGGSQNHGLRSKSGNFSEDIKMVMRILTAWARNTTAEGLSFSQDESDLVDGLDKAANNVLRWWAKMKDEKDRNDKVEGEIRQHIQNYRKQII